MKWSTVHTTRGLQWTCWDYIMSVLLMDLEEYVNYTISVRVYTSVGPGPDSEPVTVLANEDGKFS